MHKKFQQREELDVDGILITFVASLAIAGGVLMYSLLRAEK
jgi:hypothetical protein